MSDEKIQDNVETDGVQEADDVQGDCGCGAVSGSASQKLWKTIFFVAVIGSALAVAAHAYLNRGPDGTAGAAAVAGDACCPVSGDSEAATAGAALTCPSGMNSASEGSAAKTGAAGLVCPSGIDGAAKGAEGSAAKGDECCAEGTCTEETCPKAGAEGSCAKADDCDAKETCPKAGAEGSEAKTNEGSSTTSMS